MATATATQKAQRKAHSPKFSLFKVEDGKLVLDLHRGQTQAWDSTARIIAVISGTQGGKTSFGPWWLWREIKRCGPGDYIAATATYDLFKLKMLPEMLRIFVRTLGIARHWAGDGVLEICEHEFNEDTGLWEPKPGIFRAKRSTDEMWGRVILRSASAEGGLESATALAAWLDEAGQDDFTIGAYEAVLRRLSLSRGRVLITTTPYNLGWLKQEVYDRRHDKAVDVIQFASVVNPAFPIEEFEDRKRTMQDWKFRMFYLGQFERPAGLIYGAFIDKYRESGGHKVKAFSVPAAWPRWVGVDPGGNNLAKIWVAKDPVNEVYYVYRESLEGDKSTAEHALDALALAARNRERVVQWFVGNAGEGQWRKDWIAAGVLNVSGPPFSEVESGIDRVIALLKEYRLYVFDTCTGLCDEFGTYRRKLDELDEPTEQIMNKERYHRLDALRYVAIGIDDRAGQSERGTVPGGRR